MDKVDLHIHSFYSDGTMSPSEIIAEAKRLGIKKIAITDHNVLEGNDLALSLAPDYVIPGVEIDALEDGIDVHILAYNYNLADQEFRKFIKENNQKLMETDDMLIDKMIAGGEPLSKNEYKNYQYDRRLGGWKALNYLIELGYIKTVPDCFKLMAKFNHSHANIPFLSVEEVIKIIHKAGGKAVLAHPGKTFSLEKMDYYLEKIISYGIDGIEAYYPAHSLDFRMKLSDLAKRNNLLITCGNDCHGTFQSTWIGEVQADIKDLNLEGLI